MLRKGSSGSLGDRPGPEVDVAHYSAQMHMESVCSSLLFLPGLCAVLCNNMIQYATRFLPLEELSTWLAEGDTVDVPLKAMLIEGRKKPEKSHLAKSGIQSWTVQYTVIQKHPETHYTSFLDISSNECVHWVPAKQIFWLET